MSSEPTPLPTLEYSTPQESSLAPIVRIVAITGMVWGALIALQGAGLLITYFLQARGRSGSIWIGTSLPYLQLLGIVLIPTGIGWLRGSLLFKSLFRSTLLILFVGTLAYTAINAAIGLSRRNSYPSYLIVMMGRQFLNVIGTSLLPAALFLISGRLPPRRGVY